ncbi:hypothetical protein EC991775_3091, partial [Escherichia coli 99.1775]
MNDEMKGKSGKVKVMYVRSDDDSDKRTHNPRTGKGGGRPGKSRADGGRRPARDDKQSQPRDRKWEDSPWRTVSRALTTQHFRINKTFTTDATVIGLFRRLITRRAGNRA